MHTISKSTYEFDLNFSENDDDGGGDSNNKNDDDGGGDNNDNDDDGFAMLYWCWAVDFIHLAQQSGTKCKTRHDTIKYYR